MTDLFAMRVLRWSELDGQARDMLIARNAAGLPDAAFRDGIRHLVQDVRDRGDSAVLDALDRFDDCRLTAAELRVSAREFTEARAELAPHTRQAIQAAIANATHFNEEVLKHQGWTAEIAAGVRVGQRSTPVASAGLFVPGGKASYPSVLIHLGVPATVAGVPEISVAVPPLPGQGGKVDAAVLVVAEELGIRNVYRVNGPAGIAALAFGTETIAKALKIAGPGSPAVVCAQLEAQRSGVDVVVLGPTDSMVIADSSANPVHVAADVLNEAEHGTDSSSLLLTWDEEFLARVQREIGAQFDALPAQQRERAAAALGRNGGAVLVRDAEEASEVANLYAPEHLLVNTSSNPSIVERITNAGELLVGGSTPIGMANFTIGIPNSLPTGGLARTHSGVTAETFRKRMATAELSPSGFSVLAAHTIAFAEHEGFPAHAASTQVRLRVASLPTAEVPGR